MNDCSGSDYCRISYFLSRLSNCLVLLFCKENYCSEITVKYQEDVIALKISEALPEVVNLGPSRPVARTEMSCAPWFVFVSGQVGIRVYAILLPEVQRPKVWAFHCSALKWLLQLYFLFCLACEKTCCAFEYIHSKYDFVFHLQCTSVEEQQRNSSSNRLQL